MQYSMNSLFDNPPQALTVGQLAWQIKRIIEADPILSDIAVEGEISNFKAHTSGHLYFTLKDDAAQLRSCMWKTQVRHLSFRPSDGDRVIATAQTGIPNSIEADKVVSGYPAIDNRLWLKSSAVFKRLPELLKRIETLERDKR